MFMDVIVVDKFVSMEENNTIDLFVVLKLFTTCALLWTREQDVYCFVYEMRKVINIMRE